MGCGWASGSYANTRWEDVGKRALYVEFDFDVLPEPIISRDELLQPPFSAVNWNTQASGILINVRVARALEDEWKQRTARR